MLCEEITLLVQDENAVGNIYNKLKLNFNKVKVSVRDIITERIYQEVLKYNQQAEEYKYALVQPTEDEIRLNNLQGKTKKRIDAEKQLAVALAAFDGNGFFLLVDDKQLESLDEIVTIKPNTIVSFIKLTPLVGG
jgi:hypothetical protein